MAVKHLFLGPDEFDDQWVVFRPYLDVSNHATLAQKISVVLTRMKKSISETVETRRRIIKTAAAEFRRNGIQGTGLTDVMAAAGLTHGGFYRHFKSKDHLVAEACTAAIGPVIADCLKAATSRAPRGTAAFQSTLENYLSKAHRDNEAGGCLFAALGSELARGDVETREAASDGLLKFVGSVEAQLRLVRPEAAKARAALAVAAMIGAVTMSRIVTDPKLSAAILRDVKKQLADI